MRNLPVLLVALGGLTALVMPAAAAESDNGSCANASATSSAAINLEAIPMTSGAGPKAVKSGNDECGGDRSTERGDQELGDSDD